MTGSVSSSTTVASMNSSQVTTEKLEALCAVMNVREGDYEELCRELCKEISNAYPTQNVAVVLADSTMQITAEDIASKVANSPKLSVESGDPILHGFKARRSATDAELKKYECFVVADGGSASPLELFLIERIDLIGVPFSPMPLMGKVYQGVVQVLKPNKASFRMAIPCLVTALAVFCARWLLLNPNEPIMFANNDDLIPRLNRNGAINICTVIFGLLPFLIPRAVQRVDCRTLKKAALGAAGALGVSAVNVLILTCMTGYSILWVLLACYVSDMVLKRMLRFALSYRGRRSLPRTPVPTRAVAPVVPSIPVAPPPLTTGHMHMDSIGHYNHAPQLANPNAAPGVFKAGRKTMRNGHTSSGMEGKHLGRRGSWAGFKEIFAANKDTKDGVTHPNVAAAAEVAAAATRSEDRRRRATMEGDALHMSSPLERIPSGVMLETSGGGILRH